MSASPADPAGPAPAGGIVTRLGVRRVINGATTLTALGGSLMPEPVLEAMRQAAGSFVDMHELQRAAGRHLAELTRNQDACVVASCAAGLCIATLACITGGDPQKIARLPAGFGLPTEIVIHRSHRIPYDRAIELAGGRIVEYGGPLVTHGSELEAAIGERTAAVLHVAGTHLGQGAPPLETVIEIARRHGVPVLVDAAAQLPPPSNLWRFTVDLGADLALFSGGKSLRGPQASGLVTGRSDLIEACRANLSPHQRLARAMKVGKEEIAGLVRAVELYLATDHQAEAAHLRGVCDRWAGTLSDLRGVAITVEATNEAGQPLPRVRLDLGPEAACDAATLASRLWEDDPRVAVLAGPGRVWLTPELLGAGEAELVASRIRRVLA